MLPTVRAHLQNLESVAIERGSVWRLSPAVILIEFYKKDLNYYFQSDGLTFSHLLALLHPGGLQTSGRTVPDPAAAWAFRSAPFAACSSSTTEPTARSTASTAAARSQRAGGPATEYPVLPSGGWGRGQRLGIHTWNLLLMAQFLPNLPNIMAKVI